MMVISFSCCFSSGGALLSLFISIMLLSTLLSIAFAISATRPLSSMQLSAARIPNNDEKKNLLLQRRQRQQSSKLILFSQQYYDDGYYYENNNDEYDDDGSSNQSNNNNSLWNNNQQRLYRDTKFNREDSWPQSSSRSNRRQQQQQQQQENNGGASSSNLNFILNSQSSSQGQRGRRQDFQRTSGSPSDWSKASDGGRESQLLYDVQNNYNSDNGGYYDTTVGGGGGGLTPMITSSQNSIIGEDYTDNFRRGPQSEDFRQSTRLQSLKKQSQRNGRSPVMNSAVASMGSMNPRRDKQDFREYGISRMREEEEQLGVDRWDDNDSDRNRWDDDIMFEEDFGDDDTKIRDFGSGIGNIGQWQKEQYGRDVGRQSDASSFYGDDGSYFYEPMVGDYGWKAEERQHRLWQQEQEEEEKRQQQQLMQRQQMNGNENNREVAFSRSRPSSMSPPNFSSRREEEEREQYVPPFSAKSKRQDKKRFDMPLPPKASPTFTYQNERNDYRTRGELQTQQFGREVAFGRLPQQQQFGSINDDYYKERQQQLRETKSTTFGQQTRQQPPQQQRPPAPTIDITQEQTYKRMTPPKYSSSGQQRSLETKREFTKQLKSVQKPQQYDRERINSSRPRKKNSSARDEPLPFFRTIGKAVIDGANYVSDQIASADSKLSDVASSEEDKLTKVLLADARAYLSNDSAIRNLLGGSTITLGDVESRSYTSTIVNGRNRSRCQLSFPIMGDGRMTEARARLVASDDEITRLDVDIGDGIIEVKKLDRPRGFNLQDIEDVSSSSRVDETRYW